MRNLKKNLFLLKLHQNNIAKTLINFACLPIFGFPGILLLQADYVLYCYGWLWLLF